MSKVAVFFNVGMAGHVNATLPIVGALKDAGWTVLYYGYGDWQAKVEAVGGEWRTFYPDFDTGHHNWGAHLPRANQPAAVAILPMLLNEMKALDPQPSVILYDLFAVWGSYVGQILNIPAVCTCCSPVLDIGVLPQNAPPYKITPINHAAIRTLKEDYGIETSVDECITTYSPLLNILFTSEEYHHKDYECRGPILWAGPMITPRPLSTGDDEYLEQCRQSTGNGKSLVLLSMGTAVRNSDEFYQLCYEALGPLADEGVSVMMAMGRAMDGNSAAADAGAGAPPNFLCRSPHVPQLECLALSSCFITHGGMNSVQESLSANVPMVIIPGFGDQPINGKRVQELGAGLCLEKPGLTAQALRSAVQQVLKEKSFAETAQELGATLRACPGLQGIVKVLEKL